MPWKNLTATEKDLGQALNAFDWKRAGEIVHDLIEEIRSREDPAPEALAKGMLGKLRRKRRLGMLAALAEALIESGQQAAQVRRQYAQALIDFGYLAPAERMLEALVQDAKGTAEEDEARGLIGRIHKQTYVNNRASRCQRNRLHLERAIAEYLYAYRLRPETNLWHGINVVALAEMARRDGARKQGLPDSKALAKEMLDVLERRQAGSAEGLSTWDLATAMEARLALGDFKTATELALDYTESANADAFEINSTLRQLTEVWELTASKPPGSRLLPILRAALVRRQGSTLQIDAGQAKADAKPDVVPGLEKVFEAGRFQTLKWYQLGLERAKSVARIERPDGRGFGTGWLVKADDFFPDQPDQKAKLLVVTNHHVISDPPYLGAALRPDQARVHFQMLDLLLEVDKIVWSSPPGECDATFVSLKKKPGDAQPLELANAEVKMAEPAPRLYVIGHPGGRDLEFSLEDTQLVGANQRLLHYRTPTEGGSSGSPVFEDLEWKVVALHHAGNTEMKRLDKKKGVYEANEGITVQCIQKTIAKKG